MAPATGARLLYLTTVGRKSGKSRIVPLAFVRDDNDDYIVAASNGGSDWQPAWWLNLRSRPEATIEVDDTKVTASAVDDKDRDRLWRLSEQLDAYERYERKVSRQIALVRLQPVDQP